MTHPDLRQIALYALPVLFGASSLACLAVTRMIPPPTITPAPMASFTATPRTPHSAAPTATRLKDEGKSPLDPSPTLGSHPPTATSYPGLSQLPPGTYLITSPRNEDGLLIRTLDGKLVASVPQPESEPDWNAKHQKLAFTQRTNQIGILEFPYLEVKELANIPPGTTPSWSPEGGMFVYVYYSENPFELPQGLQIVYPAAEWTSPVPLSLRRLANPAWSPDDKLIAFVGSDTDELYGARLYVIDTICVRHPVSCEITLWALPIGDQIASVSWPSWSADSKMLAFQCTSEEPFVTSICIFDFATRDTHFLGDSPQPGTRPRWSPDGEWIAYTADRSVHLARPDGSEAHALPSTAGETAEGWLIVYRR